MTRSRAVGACIALIVCLTTSGSGNAETSGGHRVQATLLETGTSVRTSLSNHDSYLLRVSPHHGQPFLARVTDDFPSYAEPLPDSLRQKGATFSIVLRRADFCDKSASTLTGAVADSTMPYGTAEPLQCFTLVHGSWRGDKLPSDEWWK